MCYISFPTLPVLLRVRQVGCVNVCTQFAILSPDRAHTTHTRQGWLELARARYGSSPTLAADHLHHSKHLRATTGLAVRAGSGGQNDVLVLEPWHVAAAATKPAQDNGAEADHGRRTPGTTETPARAAAEQRAAGSSGVGGSGSGSIIEELAARFGCDTQLRYDRRVPGAAVCGARLCADVPGCRRA